MKTDVLLEHLEAAAELLSVKVSYEQLGHVAHQRHGGLCRLRGQYRVIIDKRATPQERVATLAASLATLDFGDLALRNEVRDALMFYSTRKAS